MARARRPPTRRARDGCAVETGRLAPIVIAFIDAWQRERPATAGRFSISVATVTAYEWLEAETSLSQETLERIVRFRPGGRKSSPVIELWIAERIVLAIGRPDYFHDGTLPVIQNPLASAEARLACARELLGCCGGSSV